MTQYNFLSIVDKTAKSSQSQSQSQLVPNLKNQSQNQFKPESKFHSQS